MQMNKAKPTVLVVDGERNEIQSLIEILGHSYKVKVAAQDADYEETVQTALAIQPDLILLSVMRPVLNGYEICRSLKSSNRLSDIPVIILTSENEPDLAGQASAIGAADCLFRPIEASSLLAKVKMHISLKITHSLLKDKLQGIASGIPPQQKMLTVLQDVCLLAMDSLAEISFDETGSHIMRTQLYVWALTHRLAQQGKFKQVCRPENLNLLAKSAFLHDLGKTGIPDYILLKPSTLSAHEFNIMKTHTTLGLHAIGFMEKIMGVSAESLRFAKEMAYSHHEHWDGSGYPQGLAGEEIPVSARLMSVADVYDALISERVYKKAFPHDTAVRIIGDAAGKQFDPEIVAAFLELEQSFQYISQCNTNRTLPRLYANISDSLLDRK